jgi:DNA polymerase-1
MPTKGLSEAKLYGEKEARERLGVDPKQIPDYKALAGDPSDNYPGVAGIGPKTAGDLLNKFHTVEALYKALDKNAHIEGTSEGVLEKLRKDKENAFMSKTLATIKTDVPIDITYVALKEEQFSNENVIEVLQNLGFQSLVKRLTKREDGNVSEKKKAKKLTETKDAGEQLSLV